MARYEQTKRSPITKKLRDGMRRYRKFSDLEVQHVELDAERFEKLCDNIDALYDMLETENGHLRKRLDRYVFDNKVIVNVKMRIDWESMASELERAAETVRTLREGDDE